MHFKKYDNVFGALRVQLVLLPLSKVHITRLLLLHTYISLQPGLFRTGFLMVGIAREPKEYIFGCSLIDWRKLYDFIDIIVRHYTFGFIINYSVRWLVGI